MQLTIDAGDIPAVRAFWRAVLSYRVAAALAAGGRLVFDGNAPSSWTLADPEGNEVDVATWLGRE